MGHKNCIGDRFRGFSSVSKVTFKNLILERTEVCLFSEGAFVGGPGGVLGGIFEEGPGGSLLGEPDAVEEADLLSTFWSDPASVCPDSSWSGEAPVESVSPAIYQ